MTLQQRLSFDTSNLALQLAWDSTSLGVFKECPRKYQYSIIEGRVPRQTSVHLTFGLLYHAALERYDHARSAGASHEVAQIQAVRYALEATWDNAIGRPWYSGDSNKNRESLVRTVIWYLEEFRDDPCVTIQLANGKPAVELSFRMDMGMDPYVYCGHYDRLVEFSDDQWVLDRKTTKHTINAQSFDKYTPDNQFSGYVLSGQIVHNIQVKGLIVDLAQVGATFSRFLRGPVLRHESQLEEWLNDAKHYIREAEACAAAQYWPMNDKACGNYGGCDYRSVCSKPVAQRQQWLEADFILRAWDPLQVRGDI